MKYFLFWLTGLGVGLIVAKYHYDVEPDLSGLENEINDLQLKVELTEAANKNLHDEINSLNTKIEESKTKEDSLIDYQNKIYVYYEKQINSIDDIHDDSISHVFTELVNSFERND